MVQWRASASDIVARCSVLRMRSYLPSAQLSSIRPKPRDAFSAPTRQLDAQWPSYDINNAAGPAPRAALP